MPRALSDEERVMTFFQNAPLEKAETVFNMMRAVLAARGSVGSTMSNKKRAERKPRAAKSEPASRENLGTSN